MKKIKLFLTVGLIPLFLSSCASYNEMVPSWAEICSKPVDKSKAAWYKPCNLSAPKFEKVMGSNKSADAKIAGITPAVFIFKGKYDDSPP